MPEGKKHTLLLGLAFLTFLLLSSFENTVFFNIILRDVLQNWLLAFGVLFLHNILVISLILLGMTFYVSLVTSGFFKREKHPHIVLEHPRTFAIIFTVVIVFLSILRGGTLIYGKISLEDLPTILLISTPVGIVEGYGIYLTIKKTLSRTLQTRDLALIYGVFLVAAIMEVVFINALIIVLKQAA
ncbi:MAG: hypothetical protein ACUVTE_00620 [Candidatus Bathycorpusculaceae bacterium]